MPAALRPLGQRGEQQRPRPGAEIEDRRGRAAGEMRDRRLDQRLAVGPRDQRAGADRKTDRPEIARAGDVGDRFVRQAALDQRGEAAGHGIVEVPEQQLLAGDAERVRHQQFGVEAGRTVDRAASTARSCRRSRGAAATLRPCRSAGCQPSSVASRSASSSAISAPTSSSISPFENFGQAVQRQVDAVIGHAPLREIVGPDPLRTIARPDHRLARRPTARRQPLALGLVQPRAQHLQRLGLVLVLRFLVLLDHHQPGRQMRDPHRASRWC